ncbi:MAG: L,D-transpeptidase [candidate division Zixibacteria bacterium]|nr:L,D-transpeptidase [candidate division Zixibacteria bacterium]
MRVLSCLLFSVAVVAVTLLIVRRPMMTTAVDTIQPSEVLYNGRITAFGGANGDSDTTGRRSQARHLKGPYIVIDRYCNKLFLRTEDSILLEALCSTGSGGELVDAPTGRRWQFDTPPGVFTVDAKLTNPWWRKPDWAFIEEGIPVPKNDAERLDDQMMGEYAIGFGDGFFIHGTIYERLLGVAVTHGCVRLGTADLKKLYDHTRIGTSVYVF